MGNKQKAEKSGVSSILSDIEDFTGGSRGLSMHSLQEDLEETRSLMIEAWVRLMVRTLKSRETTDPHWQNTCQRVEKAIMEFTPDLFWKVLSVPESLRSRQAIQSRVRELGREQKSRNLLKKAASVLIDIHAISKRMTKRAVKRLQSLDNTASDHKDLQLASENRDMKLSMAAILESEFSQSYHPFSAVKRIFAEEVEAKYRQLLEETDFSGRGEDGVVLEMLARDFKAVCAFLLKSCQIYKEWVHFFTSLQEKGYLRYMRKIVTNSLFDAPSPLYSLLFRTLKSCNSSYISSVMLNLSSSVSIAKFHIKKELEVEGNYTKSLIMLSEVDRIGHPKRMLRFLETLKTQIENDIEFHSQLFGCTKPTTIDGDNLLSILCFMLCRMKFKLGDLHAQLMVLHVVYGDGLMTEHDSASYMVTALAAAIDYLSTQEFAKGMQ